MMPKKSGKMFNEVFLRFEKRQSQKGKKGEKASEVVLTMKSIIIVSLSCLSLLISLLKSC
jgi:hypothetical protein